MGLLLGRILAALIKPLSYLAGMFLLRREAAKDARNADNLAGHERITDAEKRIAAPDYDTDKRLSDIAAGKWKRD
jgi:hypothetical protein